MDKDFSIFSKKPRKILDRFFDGRNLSGSSYTIDIIKESIDFLSKVEWSRDVDVSGAYNNRVIDQVIQSLKQVEAELGKTSFDTQFKGWCRWRSKYAKSFAQTLAGLFAGWITVLQPIMLSIKRSEITQIEGIPSNVMKSTLKVSRLFIEVVRATNTLLGRATPKETQKILADLMKSPGGRRVKVVFHHAQLIVGNLLDYAQSELSEIAQEAEEEEEENAPDPVPAYATSPYPNWGDISISSGDYNDRFSIELGGQSTPVHLRTGDYGNPDSFFSMLVARMNGAATNLGSNTTFDYAYDDANQTIVIKTANATPFGMDLSGNYPFIPPVHIPAPPIPPALPSPMPQPQPNKLANDLGLTNRKYSGQTSYTGQY